MWRGHRSAATATPQERALQQPLLVEALGPSTSATTTTCLGRGTIHSTTPLRIAMTARVAASDGHRLWGSRVGHPAAGPARPHRGAHHVPPGTRMHRGGPAPPPAKTSQHTLRAPRGTHCDKNASAHRSGEIRACLKKANCAASARATAWDVAASWAPSPACQQGFEFWLPGVRGESEECLAGPASAGVRTCYSSACGAPKPATCSGPQTGATLGAKRSQASRYTALSLSGRGARKAPARPGGPEPPPPEAAERPASGARCLALRDTVAPTWARLGVGGLRRAGGGPRGRGRGRPEGVEGAPLGVLAGDGRSWPDFHERLGASGAFGGVASAGGPAPLVGAPSSAEPPRDTQAPPRGTNPVPSPRGSGRCVIHMQAPASSMPQGPSPTS